MTEQEYNKIQLALQRKYNGWDWSKCFFSRQYIEKVMVYNYDTVVTILKAYFSNELKHISYNPEHKPHVGLVLGAIGLTQS